MELRTLRSFLAVAREGNVTRAARQLHITQPALSRQLAELEREMGCELLVREPRGVTLTEQGMLLRKRADEIVSLADRAERELRAPAAEVEGDVWVGGGESRAMAHAASVATRIVDEHPGVRLRIHSGNGADVMEHAALGRAHHAGLPRVEALPAALTCVRVVPVWYSRNPMYSFVHTTFDLTRG